MVGLQKIRIEIEWGTEVSIGWGEITGKLYPPVLCGYSRKEEEGKKEEEKEEEEEEDGEQTYDTIHGGPQSPFQVRDGIPLHDSGNAKALLCLCVGFYFPLLFCCLELGLGLYKRVIYWDWNSFFFFFFFCILLLLHSSLFVLLGLFVTR
ncbi:hypothetical protein L211DRAFT_62806 [Terfezia boudieri ATCC MYA-4762]|uniref:Uncharacterized protein n=1 Tax=Terfezia boudieri ATCC MYA-4762 TaxID=1051890 RepID=A0A3N4LSM7_9PEZI|nr:hypothetical protein L211DRAFT_62806 [Terfezia boudieri ATCC MYA-4762]